MSATVTIRHATSSDTDALERLAALDSASAPPGEVLLAEVGNELWAAVGIEGGRAVADPFRASGELVELLRLRAERLRSEHARPSRRLRLIPRAA
jgi:hypothetical protein